MVSGGPYPANPPNQPDEGPLRALPDLEVKFTVTCSGKPRTSYELSRQQKSAQLGLHTTASLPQELAAGYTDPLGKTSDWPFLIL